MLVKIFSFLLAAALVSLPVKADDISFFHNGIDYWGKATPAAVPQAQPPAPFATPPTADEFPWERYLDPKNKEFFREGDYTPPEPFMEIARHPTDENLGRWFSYIEKKNEIARRLNGRMQEYVAAKGMAPGPNIDPPTVGHAPISAVDVDPRRYTVRFYFDPDCPHCKRMTATVIELMHQGFEVEGRQVTEVNAPQAAYPFPNARAGPDETKRLGINSVPVLLVADRKLNRVYRISGFVPVADVIAELRKR